MLSRRGMIFIGVFVLALTLAGCQESEKDIYSQCRAFLDEVYQTMETHYYQKLDQESFEAFIDRFNTEIYPRLRQEGRSFNYVKWRSAAYMIEALRSSEDIFSAFYPPKPAQNYEAQALGKVTGPRRSLGIKGKIVDNGYEIVYLEPRCDAYGKGLRAGDVLLSVEGTSLKGLDENAIERILTPEADVTVDIKFWSAQDQQEKEVTVKAKEFFKQLVFMTPVKIPGIYCLRIKRFNRKTFEDMFRYLKFFRQKGPILGLILDLRGNPGGPPLAAREIASFFLPGGEDFTYFKRKEEKISSLDIPVLAQKYRYHGPMVILIDHDSGSASELFSGVMQKRKRAFLMGSNSAGQVMLKSMFHFEDGSMVLLITARGHHPDGTVFSFSGLTPDKRFPENQKTDLVDYAAKFLYYLRLKVEGLRR